MDIGMDVVKVWHGTPCMSESMVIFQDSCSGFYKDKKRLYQQVRSILR